MEEEKLRGVNLGGWLLMEGYLLGGRNIPEREFKERKRNWRGLNRLFVITLAGKKILR